MIKAIIFDLDNCLSPADQIGRELYDPAFEKIRQANKGRLSDEALARAFSDAWRHPLDWVAREHGFSDEMLAAGWEAFVGMEVTKPMCGYPDLKMLAEIPVLRFLVTSGFRRLQESKITAIGFAGLFTGIYVDAIDEGSRKGKLGIFQEILATYRLGAEEVLVVGDNSESEIEAGNRLGIKTVQILRDGVPRGTNATFYIHELTELQDILARERAE